MHSNTWLKAAHQFYCFVKMENFENAVSIQEIGTWVQALIIIGTGALPCFLALYPPGRLLLRLLLLMASPLPVQDFLPMMASMLCNHE